MQLRARGGPVQRGTPYVVGEEGWEVFVPDAAGRILNQRQLSSSKFAGAAGAMGGGGDTYVSLTAPAGAPLAWAREAEQALYNLMKSRGPRGQLKFQRG